MTWERKCVYWSKKQGHLENSVYNSILVFVLVSKTVTFHLYSFTIESLVCKPSWMLYCPTAQRQSCVFRSEGVSGGEQHHTAPHYECKRVVCYIKLIGSVFSDHDPSQPSLMWRRDWALIMLQLTQLLLFVSETEILLLSVATYIETKAKRNPLLQAYHDTPRNLTQPDRHFSTMK